MPDDQRPRSDRSADLVRAVAQLTAAKRSRDAFGPMDRPAAATRAFEQARDDVARLLRDEPTHRDQLERELGIDLSHTPLSGGSSTTLPPTLPSRPAARDLAIPTPNAPTQQTVPAPPLGTNRPLVRERGGQRGAATGAKLGSTLGPVGGLVGARLGSAVGAKANAATATALGGAINRLHGLGGGLRRIPGGWRLAAAYERAIPSAQQFIAKGGSLSAGIEWFARRNPLYRIFSRFLPQTPWVRNSVGLGCGCASGCGSGSTCCTCSCSCLPFMIVPAIMLGAALYLNGLFSGFALPALCERTGIACDGGSGKVGFAIRAEDLPPGAVTAWRQAEAETGVPWFYLAAWEKVTTDFGRADLSQEKMNEQAPNPPAEIFALARAVLGNSLDLAASDDPAPADTAAAVAPGLLDALQQKVDRLRSMLRGGSFGQMLVTTDEWTRYGKPAEPIDPGSSPETAPGGGGTGGIADGGGDFGAYLTVTTPKLCNGKLLNPVPNPAKNPADRRALTRSLLETLGADPNNPEMIRAAEAWAQAETSGTSGPIDSANPYSLSAGSTTLECGSFGQDMAIFPNLETAGRETARHLLKPTLPASYKYAQVVAAARANDPIGFMIWVAASSWNAPDHYQCAKGANVLFAYYEDLGGTIPPLIEDCVVTGDQYTAALANRVLNPYVRLDSGVIIGRHMVDHFADRITLGKTSFTNAAAASVSQPSLTEVLAMQEYFTLLADTERSGGETLSAGAAMPSFFGSLIGYREDTGLLGAEQPKPKIEGSVTTTATWPDKENVPTTLKGKPVSPEQLAYACTLVVQKSSFLYEGEPTIREKYEQESCRRFEVRPKPIVFDPAVTTLRAALDTVYIPAVDAPTPGRAITDRGRLSTLMSALIADPELFGDPTVVVTVPGLNGDEITVNMYAAAIDAYAFAIYDAYSAAQLRRGGVDGPDARARGAELRFYGPLVDEALTTAGIPINRAVPLAILAADQVLGYPTMTAGGCRPFVSTSAPADGTAPSGEAGLAVGRRYEAVKPNLGENLSELTVALQNGVDPLLLAALAESSESLPDATHLGLFGFTKGDWGALFLSTDPSIEEQATAATLRLRDLLRGYGNLTQAIAGFHVGEERLADANGKITALPSAEQTYIRAVQKRYAALIASSPLQTAMADAPVSGLIGCYRWGSGLAERYSPSVSDDPEPYAIAMNFCPPVIGDCGNAVVRVGNKAVLVRVTDFYDGGIGESDAQIAALRPEVIAALGLTGAGPYTVTIELLGRSAVGQDLGPLGARDPATVGIDLGRAADRVLESGDPTTAVAKIVSALQLSLEQQGLNASDIPDLGHYAKFLSARGCAGQSGTVIEYDPFRSVGPDGNPFEVKVADCPYVSVAIEVLRDLLAVSSGSGMSAEYGLQAMSQFGYINPVVGGWINSGFLPRTLSLNGAAVDSLRISAGGTTYAVHSGVDFQVADFGESLVVAPANGMAYWISGTETCFSKRYPKGYSGQTEILMLKSDDGSLWMFGHVIPGFFPDPALSAAYDGSNGRAIPVSQGQTIAQIATNCGHLHLGFYLPMVNMPHRYPFIGDSNALYAAPAGKDLRLDALSVLPQTLDEYANKAASSLGEYATGKYYPNLFPPPADLSRLPGWQVTIGTGGAGGESGAVVAGTTKPKGTIFGPDGGKAAWSAVSGATGYALSALAASEPDCTRAGAVQKRVSAPTVSYTFTRADLASLPAAAFSFCVRALFADGSTTAWEHAPVSRALLTPKGGAVSGSQKLTWTPLAGATGYQVEISRTSDFANPAVHKTTAPSYTLSSPAKGDYFLRVIATVGSYLAPPGKTTGINVQ